MENSIHYGLAQCSARTKIEMRAGRDADCLAREVRDDGPRLKGQSADLIVERIGIGNARARLMYLYGDAHAFTVESPEQGGFRVSMQIPYHVEHMSRGDSMNAPTE